mmetsp:Transcript_27095/g.46722  ORF Transcript_27095/g.46722 Transcript_27095/m.46722 type:complete len:215 (-) Transcript_27095:182-826(-)
MLAMNMSRHTMRAMPATSKFAGKCRASLPASSRTGRCLRRTEQTRHEGHASDEREGGVFVVRVVTNRRGEHFLEGDVDQDAGHGSEDDAVGEVADLVALEGGPCDQPTEGLGCADEGREPDGFELAARAMVCRDSKAHSFGNIRDRHRYCNGNTNCGVIIARHESCESFGKAMHGNSSTKNHSTSKETTLSCFWIFLVDLLLHDGVIELNVRYR